MVSLRFSVCRDVHPDETVTPLYEADGVIENPQGSFDTKKYTYAQVSGTVPMSDGSEIVGQLTRKTALCTYTKLFLLKKEIFTNKLTITI